MESKKSVYYQSIDNLTDKIKVIWPRFHLYPVDEWRTDSLHLCIWLSDSPFRLLYLTSGALQGTRIKPFMIIDQKSFNTLANAWMKHATEPGPLSNYFTGDEFIFEGETFIVPGTKESHPIEELKESVENAFRRQIDKLL